MGGDEDAQSGGVMEEAPASEVPATDAAPASSTPQINLADTEPPVEEPGSPPVPPIEGKKPDVVIVDDASEPTQNLGLFIIQLMEKTLPVSTNDPRYAEIFKDVLTNHRPREHAGALVHWALWMGGVRMATMLCRGEEQDGLQYTPDAAAIKLTNNPKFVRFQPSSPARPSPGDILFLSNGPPETEHLAVYMGESSGQWKLAEAGLKAEDGSMYAGLYLHALNNRVLGTRTLIGWLPVRLLRCDAAAQ